jgi:drug/metabolite transporter (DMT)-like permease
MKTEQGVVAAFAPPASRPAEGNALGAPLDLVGLGAVVVTVLLWGSAFVGIRAAGAQLSPGGLAFGRLLVGSIALSIAVLVMRPSLPRGRDLRLVLAAGVLWFGCYNLALNTAERLVDAGTAALLVGVAPLLIITFAGLFLREGFPPRLIVGATIAFLGTVVIGVGTMGAARIDGAVWGIVLCLVAAALYAAGVTIEKPVVARVPGLSVTWLACWAGALVTAPFAPQLVADLEGATSSSIAWLIYLGLFPTSVAFLTWALALSRTTAGRLGSTMYLVAPTSVLLGWAILGEAPPLLAVAGGLVSIIGVAIARSRSILRRDV